MNWLDLALPLVAHFEGCAKRKGNLIYPYLDKLAKPNVWTRGYGRTYGITQDSSPITTDEAKQELGEGLTTYAKAVIKLAPTLAERPECYAAVVSWCWNCGIGAFRHSRLRREINNGNWQAAAQFIGTPKTAGGIEYPGLVRRRAAETALFRKGLNTNG